MSTRLERLEQALANESTSRQEESSKQIAMLHELTSELSKSQLTALTEFEDSVRSKLGAALAEAQAAQQTAGEERQLRRQQIQKETKDRWLRAKGMARRARWAWKREGEADSRRWFGM